jgi:hypothetical protein
MSLPLAIFSALIAETYPIVYSEKQTNTPSGDIKETAWKWGKKFFFWYSKVVTQHTGNLVCSSSETNYPILTTIVIYSLLSTFF